MPQLEIDDDILVEWIERPGVEQVGIFDRKKKKENAQRSQKAITDAMNTIKKMAKRVKELNDAIPVEFSQIEITFGIALDYEVGAIISKASTEASIGVKLSWDRKAQSKTKTKNARRSSSSKTS